MEQRRFHERRSGQDRRAKPTSPWSFASIRGKRREGRRAEDRRRPFYVDRYAPRLLVVVSAVLLLSVLDAFLTLRLVALGGREINPIMDFFLQAGAVPFLAVKYALTVGGLVMLLVHKNFYVVVGRFRVKYLLPLLFAGYVLLILWECYLLYLAS